MFDEVRSSKTQFTAAHEETFVAIFFVFSVWFPGMSVYFFPSQALPQPCHQTLLPSVCCSACGLEAQRIEEMEKMLREAQQEKARLMENRVSARL